MDYSRLYALQFGEDVYLLTEALKSAGFDLKNEVKSRDFYRVIIDGILQVDFVNDRVYRYGKSDIFKGYRVDNKINILANKLSAIVGRDEEKDIFDLFSLSYHESFNWKEILGIANKKSIVEKDILIYRLKNFPLSWLERIKTIKKMSITKEQVEQLCDDILYDRENSLKLCK